MEPTVNVVLVTAWSIHRYEYFTKRGVLEQTLIEWHT
jgi:hypothetical protein